MSKTNLRQYCLCPTSTPTPESPSSNTQELIPFEAAGNYLIAHPEYQLCNLAAFLASSLASISNPNPNPASPEDIRAQLLQQGIP